MPIFKKGQIFYKDACWDRLHMQHWNSERESIWLTNKLNNGEGFVIYSKISAKNRNKIFQHLEKYVERKW